MLLDNNYDNFKYLLDKAFVMENKHREMEEKKQKRKLQKQSRGSTQTHIAP
jgi:hypothetical protein